MRRPISQGLLVLLKVHAFFGFGNIFAGERIGRYMVREINDRRMICIGEQGDCVEEREFRRYALDYGAGSSRIVYRARGGILRNMWENFMTRFDVKNDYLGQPIYGRRRDLPVILKDE
jgi:hypothetical protein